MISERNKLDSDLRNNKSPSVENFKTFKKFKFGQPGPNLVFKIHDPLGLSKSFKKT